MDLPVYFQYNKEEQVGSGCVTLRAATLDWGCTSPMSKGVHESKLCKIFRHICATAMSD